jgi:plastocyanin
VLFRSATAGTDYQAPVSATGILKSSGVSGNVSAAVAGTDYQAPVSATGILKSSGVSGNVSAAVAGTDYQVPITLTTTGSSGAATFSSGTLNIPQYAGGGASTFSGLSDATSAALTVDEIYLQATTRLIVTANGSSAYLFDQYTGNNPTVYATSGTTIAFDLGTGALSSHPFLIRLSGANYNTGLTHVTSAGVITTGSSAQGKTSGTLYWKIPADISGTYGYLCSNHGSMAGTITINPATVTATSLSLGNVTNESKVTMFTSPTFTGTVSGVTATHVGLGNVTNESKATMFTSPSLTGTASLGTDQTDYLVAIGASGTARLETAGGTANINLALSTKGTGSVYFWRGGYGTTQTAIINQYGIGLSTAIPSSGTGITFPTSASASANANTLDDYEEGTWTPSVGGTATYGTRIAHYTKIGDTVRAFFDITIGTIGTGSLTTMSGFPFTCTNNDSGCISYFAGLGATVYSIQIQMSGTNCIFVGLTAAGATINNGMNVFTTGARIIGTVVYKTTT